MTGCLNAKSTKKHWILSELCIFGHKQEIKKIPFISIKKMLSFINKAEYTVQSYAAGKG